MKHKFFYFLLMVVLSVFSCGPGKPEFQAVMPPLPEPLAAALGPPVWRVQWIDEHGDVRQTDLQAVAASGNRAVAATIKPMWEWTTPVLAWPYWPEKGIAPGVVHPAGGLFPLDVDAAGASGGALALTWSGGVDGVFYMKMAAYSDGQGGLRSPQNFDWGRFRLLFTDGLMNEDAAGDPWLVDWDAVALATVNSGFDRRRIKSAVSGSVGITIPWDGPWAGTSPFAETPDWAAGDEVILSTCAQPGTLFSRQGMIRYTEEGWMRIQY
jgi:hypothetical protein